MEYFACLEMQMETCVANQAVMTTPTHRKTNTHICAHAVSVCVCVHKHSHADSSHEHMEIVHI